MSKINKQQVSTILTFIFWPFFGFYQSIINYQNFSSRNFLFLFCIFFGLTMHVSVEADANRIETYLKEAYDKEIVGFESHIDYIQNDVFERIDFVQNLLIYILSRFSKDVNLLFAVMGAIFGYFYSRNIWFLIDLTNGKIRIEAFAYLSILIFIIPPWFIGGFRYYTAVQIFIFGIFHYFTGNKNGLIFIFLTIFFHDTFIISIVLFLLFLMLKQKIKPLYLFYLITILTDFLPTSIIGDVVNSLPSLFKQREGYLNEDYHEVVLEQQEAINWYIKYKYELVKILVFCSFSWIILFKFYLIKNNKLMLNLLSISLIFMGFANLVQDIPAMYRFYFLGIIPMMAFLFLFFQTTNFKRRPDWYKVVSSVVAVLFVFVETWSGMQYFTVGTIVGNPLTFWIFDYSISVYDFIKTLLS